jgi:hypothetical protein
MIEPFRILSKRHSDSPLPEPEAPSLARKSMSPCLKKELGYMYRKFWIKWHDTGAIQWFAQPRAPKDMCYAFLTPLLDCNLYIKSMLCTSSEVRFMCQETWIKSTSYS